MIVICIFLRFLTQVFYLIADLEHVDSYCTHAVYLTCIELCSAVPSFYMLYKHHVTFKREYEHASVKVNENVPITDELMLVDNECDKGSLSQSSEGSVL